ncbi:MAG: hypothetical protein ABUJ92_10075, partial [Desulfobacterales bacterium]
MKLAVILEIYITKAVVITNDSPQNWEMGSDSIYCGCGIIRTMQGLLPDVTPALKLISLLISFV